VRVDVLGEVRVSSGGRVVAGPALGGRRARVALVALALADRVLSPDRLAWMIWGDDPPATWQAAVRGVIRGLRVACAEVGGDDQRLIRTDPAGYRLAPGVEVDLVQAAGVVTHAGTMLAQGRPHIAAQLAEPVSQLSGDRLLVEESAEWVEAQRRAIDVLASRALDIVVEAAGALGDHDSAVAAARRAVTVAALDERAHRGLIAALSRAGDRAGAVRAFEQCRTLLATQLGIDPSRQTVEVYLAALGDQEGAARARLPSVSSTFVGRDDDLVALAAVLGHPGLVTVTGRGGVGKSRLVAQAAADRHDVDGGRLWVPLAGVSRNNLVAAAVALTVGVPPVGSDQDDGLADWLAPRGRTLLVLDGCEGLLDGAASLARRLLSQCPLLTLVVTSRLPLGIDGEQIFPVGPLVSPPSDDIATLRENVQVRLLLDRVRDGGADPELNDENARHIAALVRRCGGLPLALELAAAQLAVMPAGDLLDHLSEFNLDGDNQLRSIARSSYALLDPDEAAVFRRMAVLDGPVGLRLVRRVVASGELEEVRVVRLLRELAARGLIVVDRVGPYWRYHQDDDLRRYAADLLVDAGEEAATFARLAETVKARLPEDARASPAPFVEAVTATLGSLRSLFGAAVDGRADLDACLELAFRLHRYFAATNVAEGRFWLQQLLGAGSTSNWTAYATYALGYLSYWSGDILDAVTQLSAAVDMLQGIDGSYSARALIYLAGLFDDLDRGAEAVDCVRRAIAAAAHFDADLQVSAAMGMGSVLAERGDPSASQYAQDAIDLCRRGGSPEQLALAMPTAAMICWQVGDYEQCRAYIDEARPMHTDTRRIARVVLLSATAGLAFTDGDLDAAIDIGSRADTEASDLGVEREVPLIRAVLARAWLARGDTATAARWALLGLDAAEAMAIVFPLAICFETTALITSTAAAATEIEVAELLACAAALRTRGDRLPLPALSAALDFLRTTLPTVAPRDLHTVTTSARDLLDRVASVI
jgi:predicted ATPase/DNA-binding SARP family transcriptional activator